MFLLTSCKRTFVGCLHVHGREKLFHLYGYNKAGRFGRFSRLCILVAAVRTISMLCAASGSTKMDMHAFPLVRILGGNAHLEAERYCNALVIKQQSMTSILWLQILQLYPLNLSA
jgi:hypothetical protein